MHKCLSLKKFRFETWDSPLRLLRTRSVKKTSSIHNPLPKIKIPSFVAKRRLTDLDCENDKALLVRKSYNKTPKSKVNTEKEVIQNNCLGIVLSPKKIVVSTRLLKLPKLISKMCQT